MVGAIAIGAVGAADASDRLNRQSAKQKVLDRLFNSSTTHTPSPQRMAATIGPSVGDTVTTPEGANALGPADDGAAETRTGSGGAPDSTGASEAVGQGLLDKTALGGLVSTGVRQAACGNVMNRNEGTTEAGECNTGPRACLHGTQSSRHDQQRELSRLVVKLARSEQACQSGAEELIQQQPTAFRAPKPAQIRH